MGKFSKQLEDAGISIPSASAIDFERLAIRAGQVKEKMMDTFQTGKERGITTHITEVDKIFSWKPGFLYCITGYPQSGKSEWVNFLAVLKAKFDQWPWVVYSPESGDADEYFDQIAHTIAGKTPDPFYRSQMSKDEYHRAIDFIHQYFFVIEDSMLDEHGLQPTPELLREITGFYHAAHGVKGLIKDPWNTLTHKADRDDIYLSNQLAAEKRMAKRLKIANVILAHPRSPNMAGYDKTKGFDIPKAHDIANGAMWNNKCDVIGAVHRINYHLDKTDPFAVFVTHKVKKQNLVGLPGEVQIKFDRHENRYYINGACPLITPGIQPEYKPPDPPQLVHNFPPSKFEEPPF